MLHANLKSTLFTTLQHNPACTSHVQQEAKHVTQVILIFSLGIACLLIHIFLDKSAFDILFITFRLSCISSEKRTNG